VGLFADFGIFVSQNTSQRLPRNGDDDARRDSFVLHAHNVSSTLLAHGKNV